MVDQRLDETGWKSNRWLTAADGVEQLVWLGGGEHEDDVLRWLLEGLEQGVAGRPGQHVGLVEDVDAMGAAGGGHGADVDPDLADVLDLVVRGGVEFDDVERGAFGDADARGALVARLTVVAAGWCSSGPWRGAGPTVVLPVPRGPAKR